MRSVDGVKPSPEGKALMATTKAMDGELGVAIAAIAAV
jgi:hypothetical protein